MLSNGIIGITKTDSARDRFCITRGERAIISEATKYLLGIGESLTTRKDSFLSRTSKDEADVKSLVSSSNDLAHFLCVDQKLLP